jgi:DegV family protein with EDD domain
MAIRFITDSTTDLPKSLREAWDVQIAPMGAVFDGVVYLQDIDMTMEAFYERLATAPKIPTTTQINPATFAALYAPFVAAGDEVVVFCVSSGLSGTYQSACIAKADFLGAKIDVVDTLNVTLGATILVEQAARMRAAGATAAEIVSEMEDMRTRVVLYAIINDLEYPYKGGRLSAVGMRVGGMLGLKPIASIWNGVANMAGMARGMNRAYRWIADRSAREGIDERYAVLFGDTNAPHLTPELERVVFPHGSSYRVMRQPVGMVIGAHAGPGSVAMAYIKKRRT